METAELVLRSGGGLLAVLGTLWVLVRVLKARNGAAGPGPVVRLRVLARTSVGRHASVVTVDVGDRVLVLGVGEQGVRLLVEQPALSAPEPVVARVDVSDGVHPAVRPQAQVPAQRDAPASPLAGSLLDPGTWRSVVGAARERTVRR